jgi:hypothetical protein
VPIKSVVRNNITKWDSLGINFWGINKNATSTIVNHFAIAEGLIKEDEIHLSGGQKGKLKITEQFISRDEAFSNMFLNFTVVRNPYARFESCYKHLKYPLTDVQKNTRLKAKFNPNWSADEFLDFIEYMFQDANSSKVNKHYQRQSWFITNIKKMDYVIKLEKLNKRWPFKHITFPAFISNPSSKIEVKYNKDRLYNLYQEDFENFKYEKSI